ncbi:hypothetical protein U1Q18_051342 [Sarracenia purpurea var. burkii]
MQHCQGGGISVDAPNARRIYAAGRLPIPLFAVNRICVNNAGSFAPGEDGVWRYPLANVRLVGRQCIVSRFSSLTRRDGCGNEFDAITFYEFDAVTFYEFDAVTLLRDRRCYVSSAIDATIFRQCDVICFIEFTIRDSRIRTSVVGVLFARRDRVSEY